MSSQPGLLAINVYGVWRPTGAFQLESSSSLSHPPADPPWSTHSSDKFRHSIPVPLTLLSLTSAKTPVVAKACPPSSHPTHADLKRKTSTHKPESRQAAPSLFLVPTQPVAGKEGGKQELEDHRAQGRGWKGLSLGLGWRAAPPQLRMACTLSFHSHCWLLSIVRYAKVNTYTM